MRTAADPGYDPALEDLQMLMRPLFATSFLIDDALADAGFHGADAVVLSSASSKTAYGTAYLLAERGSVEVIGLTSPGNADFVRGLGLYDRVVEYGDAAGLTGRVAYVDLSGDGALRAALHRALGERLALDLIVGFTHHEALTADQADLPGPAPEGFFAPGRAQVRTQAMGRAGAGGEDRRGLGRVPGLAQPRGRAGGAGGRALDGLGRGAAHLAGARRGPLTAERRSHRVAGLAARALGHRPRAASVHDFHGPSRSHTTGSGTGRDAGRSECQPLTAVLSFEPAVNFGACEAAMWILSPVAGLMP